MKTETSFRVFFLKQHRKNSLNFFFPIKKCIFGFQLLTTGPSYYPKCTLCTGDGVLFSSQCPFFAQRPQIFCKFWPILAICRKFGHFLVTFLRAEIVRWCRKIDKYQVCAIVWVKNYRGSITALL